MAEDPAEIRRLIVLLAGRKSARKVPRSATTPCRWVPTTVTNPDVDMPFDDISAWHKIAEVVEEGCKIEEVILAHPEGEKAYVMIVELAPNMPKLYIKVQLKGQFIFGRSFHYSNEAQPKEDDGTK